MKGELCPVIRKEEGFHPAGPSPKENLHSPGSSGSPLAPTGVL